VFLKAVPNSTTHLSKRFAKKSSPSHLYRWAKGKALNLHLKTSILGSFQSFSFQFILFYFTFGDGPIKWLNAKEKRKNLKGTPSN
jgi:hypothetical protein